MKKAIIFGVLNWGLGHATRSIPIIRSLLNLQYKVVICSDGDALSLLKKEFPQAIFVNLPGYKIRYGYKSMMFNMLRHGLGMLKAIHAEEQLLGDLVQKYEPAFIISDNRYGLHHPKVKSILISHQLNIPAQKQWQSSTANHFLHNFIKKFDVCWVPDVEAQPNLSGELSHEVFLPIPIKYIGVLSRFSIRDQAIEYDIACILS